MPKRTIYQSDMNGEEVMEGEEAYVSISFPATSPDAEKVYRLVITAAEARDIIPADATATKKRGRKATDGAAPAAATAAPAAAPAAAGKK